MVRLLLTILLFIALFLSKSIKFETFGLYPLLLTDRIFIIFAEGKCNGETP